MQGELPAIPFLGVRPVNFLVHGGPDSNLVPTKVYVLPSQGPGLPGAGCLVEGEDEEGPAHGVNDVLQHLHLVLFVQPTNIGVANLHLGEERDPLDVPAPVGIL